GPSGSSFPRRAPSTQRLRRRGSVPTNAKNRCESPYSWDGLVILPRTEANRGNRGLHSSVLSVASCSNWITSPEKDYSNQVTGRDVIDPQLLLVLGASARAAAFSALRSGSIQPWCVDLFAD